MMMMMMMMKQILYNLSIFQNSFNRTNSLRIITSQSLLILSHTVLLPDDQNSKALLADIEASNLEHK